MNDVVLIYHPTHGWLLFHRRRQEIVELSDLEASMISKADIITRTKSKGFISASYEITEQCNMFCVHCYLNGQVRHPGILLREQLSVLDRIERTGVFWLQITGGEPLLSKNFERVYKHAWSHGFAITVLTNGILLGEDRFIKLFTDFPPFRVSVSIYGASKEVYETVTRCKGSWRLFQRGISRAREAGILLRLKLIEMSENISEHNDMLKMTSDVEEFDVVQDIIPTLSGDTSILQKRVQTFTDRACWEKCDAGVRTYHVTSDGQVRMCKLARKEGVCFENIDHLALFAEKYLNLPETCQNCAKRDQCGVCPPLFNLLTLNGTNPCPEKERK